MTLIHRLDRQTINSIAAGEVVERPASVAKELIDNALDAGASIIRMSMESGGIKLFSLEDDGSGMSREDALLSLESHATSKLVTTDDLFDIQTMGFRGEALPSIASVSRLELRTRRREDEAGTRIVMEGGEKTFEGPVGMAPGTAVICRDLFFNTPARYKFLRTDASEAGALADLAGKMALTRPHVSFRLDRKEDGKEILYTPGDNDLLSAIYAVFGQEAAGAMQALEGRDSGIQIAGYMTGPEGSRHNRSRQVFIVNGRIIQSAVLRTAVDEAGKTWFMKGRFPQLVLNLTIPGNLVDVNVHPQKTEMRFWDDRAVFRAVYHTIRQSLEGGGRILESVKPASFQEEKTVNSQKPQEQLVLETRKPLGKMVYPPVQEESREFPDLLVREDRADPKEILKAEKEASPPPEVKEKTRDVHSLLDARLIGTLLDTYILMEEGESLILIDQHAAHERVLYEELLEKRKEGERGSPPAQTLLVPVRIAVSESENARLEEDVDYFQKLGFDFEPFGGNSIALRTVPMTAGSQAALDPARAFRSALDSLMAARETGREVDQDEVLHQMACKAAVKAHDRLSSDEILILIRRLTDLTNPYHCPHGRPVALRLSREEIEKRFGRLV